MRSIPALILLIILTSVVPVTAAELYTVNVDRLDTSSFAGYVPNEIVVKIIKPTVFAT